MPKPKSLFPDPACRLPDEYGMLAAVLAAPTDDLPKLVYADWLEERGDPRGPFLRQWVQAKQAGKPRPKPPKGMSACWLSVIGYTLNARLAAFGEPVWADTARQTAEPGILVRTLSPEGRPLPNGVSKFGGLPDLHPDTEWPEGVDGPAALVAQWNLEELAASPVCRALPKTGLLSFFIDLPPFVEDSADGITKVVYTPSLDELDEREPDEERHRLNVLRGCRVELTEMLTLPHPSSPTLAGVDWDAATRHDYLGPIYGAASFHGLVHGILGHPWPRQTHPTPAGESGWQLLTQFASDVSAELYAGSGM